jgi:hypothetical protein
MPRGKQPHTRGRRRADRDGEAEPPREAEGEQSQRRSRAWRRRRRAALSERVRWGGPVTSRASALAATRRGCQAGTLFARLTSPPGRGPLWRDSGRDHPTPPQPNYETQRRPTQQACHQPTHGVDKVLDQIVGDSWGSAPGFRQSRVVAGQGWIPSRVSGRVWLRAMARSPVAMLVWPVRRRALRARLRRLAMVRGAVPVRMRELSSA